MKKKQMALTFDDGPEIGITDQVLDLLEKEGIRASFFLIGQQVTPETKYLVKREVALGCTIENHSFTHQDMTKFTPEVIKEEIAKTSAVIKEITGEDPQFFRPPYICVDQKMYDNIELPFICGRGCQDWVPEVSAEERCRMILEAADDGVMILVHDMKKNENTIEALKVAIPELKKRGFELVNIRELYENAGVKPVRYKMYSCVYDPVE